MEDFGPADLDLAVAFYQAVDDPTARAVLDFLVDHPEQRFDGAALVAHLRLGEHRDVARATYRLGRLAAGLHRRRPWAESQLGYLMPAAQADLLGRAREQAG